MCAQLVHSEMEELQITWQIFEHVQLPTTSLDTSLALTLPGGKHLCIFQVSYPFWKHKPWFCWEMEPTIILLQVSEAWIDEFISQ